MAYIGTNSEGIALLFKITHRLIHLVGWTIVAVAHVALIQILIVACWLAGLEVETVKSWANSAPASFLSAIGISAVGLASGWIWLLKRLYVRAVGQRIAEYLLPDA